MPVISDAMAWTKEIVAWITPVIGRPLRITGGVARLATRSYYKSSFRRLFSDRYLGLQGAAAGFKQMKLPRGGH